MKPNTIKRDNRTAVILTLVGVTVVALGVGAVFAYDKLRALNNDQCVIRDMASQVKIETDKTIRAETIAEELGLKAGANLAEIDFAKKREELLARVPLLKSLKITRKLPDKITVLAESRTPIAQLNIKGHIERTGKVVDAEGMVFTLQRDTSQLPVIREPKSPGTKAGQRLEGRARAALRLIEACRAPEFLEFHIQEVDSSNLNFLIATLGNYSKLKIRWDGMDEQTPDSQKDLLDRLTKLRHSFREKNKLAPETTTIWNATIRDTITANIQETL